MPINVQNELEKKIDDRLNDLINDSYTRSDGGFDRAKYQRLVSQRRAGRLDGRENISIQAPEYFDKEDPVYRKIFGPGAGQKPEDYGTMADEYAKNLETLKKMNKNRGLESLKDSSVIGLRDEIREYLRKGFDGEKDIEDDKEDVKALTSVPELFVKERVLDATNSLRLVNVGDLVNHIHYKIMVDREIPVDSANNQYSYDNIININKAARERLAPYVRAFLSTYEMTPQMIRRVYAKKDNNMNPNTKKDKPNSNLTSSLTSLGQALPNNLALVGLASGAVQMDGGKKKKKSSNKKKRSKGKGKKSRKSKK